MVNALKYHQGLRRLRHKAQCAPVKITRHGRRVLVLMSDEQHDWHWASAQRSHRTDPTAHVVICALAHSQMHVEYKLLNDPLK